MVKIVFTPDWFLSNDVLINVVSFFVLLLFFLFTVKSYKIEKKKSILYLGLGFLLIAVGELSTVLTKIVLYFDTDVTHEIGRVIVTSHVVESVDIFYYLGFFMNQFFTLVGLYLIYKIPAEKKLSGDFVLTVYLMFAVSLLSHTFYYFYHITAIILLMLIIRHNYKNYKENKMGTTKILIIAFGLLLFSQIVFIVSELSYFYVLAQVTQLAGYITLLALIIKITKNGKKKKQDRHNARHA